MRIIEIIFWTGIAILLALALIDGIGCGECYYY